MKTSSLPKLEIHHRNPGCITSTRELLKKTDILLLCEKLWRWSEQMFFQISKFTAISVHSVLWSYQSTVQLHSLLRKEIVAPARIILQADILNFPFLCYSWENKIIYYKETGFTFNFFWIFPIMSKILGQKGQLKHRFFIFSYENKVDPIPDSAY